MTHNEPLTTRAFWSEVIRTFVIALMIALPLKWYVAQPYLVFGQSMDPTFEQNNYLVVNRVVYYLHEPRRGDVVVFEYPNDRSQRFIKRIIGLPGETVEFKNGTPIITNEEGVRFSLNESYIINVDSLTLGGTTLKQNEYYVAGDNRPKSSDSRIWGPVPRDHIIGEVAIRLFPFTDIGYLPGNVETFK
ncbi:MAG: signal peptidase I [bacterium]|nr:signal peptidase I [bacterium]